MAFADTTDRHSSMLYEETTTMQEGFSQHRGWKFDGPTTYPTVQQEPPYSINPSLYLIHWLIEAEWGIYAFVIWPSLVQMMACRLVGTKPLSEPILEYCWFDPWE